MYYYNKNNEIIEIALYASIFNTDMNDVEENKWIQYRGITLNVPEEAVYANILINKISHTNSVPILVSKCELREINL